MGARRIEMPTKPSDTDGPLAEPPKKSGCGSKAAIVLLVVALLLGGIAMGCVCEEGCVTTATCIHSVTGETRTITVDGCTAGCPCWYEAVDVSTWCPGD